MPNTKWKFMNYGYAHLPGSSMPNLPLPSDLEFQRYPLQMYHFLADLGPIKEKHVLEVGSGRGGGAHYLYHQQNPASYTGIDFSKPAIDFSRRHFQAENLRFEVGNAERLRFDNEQFEVVLNVESSLHYANFPAFLSEVKRVLKPGGKLLLADFRNSMEIPEFRSALHNSGLSVISEEDITNNVETSLTYLSDIYQSEIQRMVPRYFRSYFLEFAALKGSHGYEMFKNKNRTYFRFVLKKS
ncbi:MAG: class I SAM-dependent methyltransferase [Lewinellaceae bacterium]|nr:class I SAM-dependent methyltransferase [Lewinellaceae bacterium]